LSEEERRYENGRDPQMLDIIDISMLAPAPLLHQSENHVIDAVYYWYKTGRLAYATLTQLADEPPTLWADGESTYHGQNDRVALDVAGRMTNSLVLIRPESLSIRVQAEGTEFGNCRRRVRACFRYHGTSYSLIITDPVAERAFLAGPDGPYPAPEGYLCVSLGRAHTDNYCYKLVAGVITEPPLRDVND